MTILTQGKYVHSATRHNICGAAIKSWYRRKARCVTVAKTVIPRGFNDAILSNSDLDGAGHGHRSHGFSCRKGKRTHPSVNSVPHHHSRLRGVSKFGNGDLLPLSNQRVEPLSETSISSLLLGFSIPLLLLQLIPRVRRRGGQFTAGQEPEESDYSEFDHAPRPFFCSLDASSAKPLQSANAAPALARLFRTMPTATPSRGVRIGSVTSIPRALPFLFLPVQDTHSHERRGRCVGARASLSTFDFAFGDCPALKSLGFRNEKPPVVVSHPGVLIDARSYRLNRDRQYLSVSIGSQGGDPNTRTSWLARFAERRELPHPPVGSS